MLLEDEKLDNKSRHRTDLFTDKYAPYNNVNNGILKELILLLLGNVLTLSLIATIAGLILSRINEIDRKAITELVTYSILFVALLTVFGTNIKNYIPKFKNLLPYVAGLGIGIAVLMINGLYLKFVNIFYTTGTGGNETTIRSIIANYPFASFLIFGLVGPMCEELTYRVGMFNLLKRWNRIWAYVITSIIFGFIHFDYSGNIITEFIILPSYIIPGLLFSFAYEKYDLPCSFMAHITNNLFVIIQLIQE